MRQIFKENAETIKIDIGKIDSLQKKEGTSFLGEKVSHDFKKAHDIFCQTAVPVALVKSITGPQFRAIYMGQGRNEPRTPINEIMSGEAVYFLFAMTLGFGVSKKISDLFCKGDYLLGHLLDLVCSSGIEAFADDITQKYFVREVSGGRLKNGDMMLRYSPGYCGWHITGQHGLHEDLQSGDIGITLTETFYMKPVKSVSGVMIGCNPTLHHFNNSYPFCGHCRMKTCRTRLAAKGSGLIADSKIGSALRPNIEKIDKC